DRVEEAPPRGATADGASPRRRSQGQSEHGHQGVYRAGAPGSLDDRTRQRHLRRPPAGRGAGAGGATGQAQGPLRRIPGSGGPVRLRPRRRAADRPEVDGGATDMKESPELVLEGGGTVWQQIEGQLRQFILSGALRAGEELPTVRAVAVGLAVNPHAV